MAKEAWEPPCFPPNLFGASFPRLELPDHHPSWAAVSDKCDAPEWERRELFLCHPRKRRNPIGWMKFLKDYCRIGNWWCPNSYGWSAANRWMSEATAALILQQRVRWGVFLVQQPVDATPPPRSTAAIVVSSSFIFLQLSILHPSWLRVCG